MPNNEADKSSGKFGNQLDSDPVDYGFTRDEILKSRGYDKEKDEKTNDK